MTRKYQNYRLQPNSLIDEEKTENTDSYHAIEVKQLTISSSVARKGAKNHTKKHESGSTGPPCTETTLLSRN